GGGPACGRRRDGRVVRRDAEWRALRDACATAVAERSRRLVTIVGPAGIGKSRLAAELCAGIRDDARLLSGRCLPYGDGITFCPLVQIVGVLGSDDAVREAPVEAEAAELGAAGVPA